MKHSRARAFYRKLLALYPEAFREQFGESMEQTFNDLYNERREMRDGLFGFVFQMYLEASASILRENLAQNSMKNITTNPTLAALAGLLLIAPFMIMNAIVVNQWQPFYSWIAGLRLNNIGGFGGGFWMVVFILLLMPLGAFVSLRPALKKGADGNRKWYVANIIVAVLLLVVFVTLSIALGKDIYQCDILQIPNCD